MQNDFIFGIRAVIEAANSGKEINKIFIQNGLKGELMKELKILLREKDVHVNYVPIEKLNRITRKNHQGVICYISPVSFYKVEDILPSLYESGKNPSFLILDRVTDVRNFGSICRSAECMDVDAIVIPTQGSALINADAIKTSAGAIHKIPICREDNLKTTIDYLKNSGVKVIGCTEKTENYTYDNDFSGPTAIIMGSEENGISPAYLEKCDNLAKIPLGGEIESLNVAVSAGIILYELNRQRISNK